MPIVVQAMVSPNIFSFRRAVVVREVAEAPNIKTLTVKLDGYLPIYPGQFNMLYVYGLGEIPVSLSGLPTYMGSSMLLEHTVRSTGAVSRAIISRLGVGSVIGIRGPYGNGWPLDKVEGRDILIVGGGIGFAPLRPVVKYIALNRGRFGRLNILLGAKTPSDLLYKYEIDEYSRVHNSTLMLSSDMHSDGWGHYVGFVTDLIDYIDVNPQNSSAFICGPEAMMRVAVRKLIDKGFNKGEIYLSLERRMRCGVGVCGTCQFGHYFTCKDGPVFSYSDLEDYLWIEGV